MDGRSSPNQTVNRNGIGKENPKRGMDQKIPLLGSEVKRKRLSDITNTVSSSRMANSNVQFQENPKEVACGITKECITRLMEENATLLKAMGERNKIIELSSIELRKLRFTLEKVNQQNRMLAQANSQMLAELTSSKERLKCLQHELGCTTVVLRLKNSELDVKETVNKELSEKIRIEEENSKLVEIATDVRQVQPVSDSIACRLDRNSQLDEEELNNELCENTRTEEHSMCAEVATRALLSQSVTDSTTCRPNRRRTLRNNKTLSSTTLTHQAEEKPNNEPHENIGAEERLNKGLSVKNNAKEEHSECAVVATDASQAHAINNYMTCEPNKKRMLRSRSAATVTYQAEAKERDARRKSSRRRSNNVTSEAHESKDNFLEIVNAIIPACSVMSEPLNEDNPVHTESSATLTHHQVEQKDKDDKRSRRCSRRRSNNLKSESCESKDHFPETVDLKNPAFSPIIIEPQNENNPVQEKTSVPSNPDNSVKHEENKATSSLCQGQELRRTSVGRPMRKAAVKVSSYKEVPLKVKMRRSE